MNAESDRPASRAIAIVVNDDPTQLDVLAGLTRKAGLEPRPFTEAEEALRAMDAGAPPDIVVTDLYMPGIDGWRFCHLLRSPEYAAFNNVPILVVSATFAGEEPRRIAAGIGADAFMGAPVDGRQFVEQLRTLLVGRQPRPFPRVLITANDAALAAELQKTFSADGYETDTALTAREAAAAFEANAYNVAVLDHHLSGEEGAALLDAFRVQRPDCVCLMMTDDPTPELALAWMKRGAAAYVRKPFEPAYLVELCDNARQQQFLLHTRDLLELRTQELKQSEERYRRITQTIHSYVYTVRIENGAPVETKHGPGCLAITGYDKTEFEADPFLWLRIVAKCDRTNVIEKVREVLSGGSTSPFEHRLVRKDGETRWVRNTCVHQYDAHGTLVAYDGLIEDITERKQAEQALAAREEMYRAIVQQMSDELYLHDLEGNFLEVDDAAVAASGYSKSELLGLNVFDLDSDMARRDEVRRMWEEMPVGYLQGFETEHRRKDGSRYPCEVNISKIAFGGREYILALARDITERKQTEAALRESEENLRTTLDSIGDAVIATDVNGAISRMNPTAETLTGWRFDEVRGAPLLRVLHIENAETREPAANPVQKVLETGKCVGLANHTVLITRDGRERQIADSAAPIRHANGETSGVVLVFRDVSEEYHLHAKLSENERFLDSVFESIQDGISVLDFDLNIVHTNQWIKEKYGWHAPLEGKKCYKVYQGRDSICPWCPTVEALETGQPARAEVPFLNADEPEGWIDLSAFPLTDENGAISGVIEYIKDITDRKRAEEELRKSEEGYRRLFETMSSGVINQAADGTITSANPASERILGLSIDQMKGKTSMDPRWRMILEDGSPVPGSEHPTMIALRTGEPIAPVTRGVYVPEREEYVWLSITAIPLFRPGEDKPFLAYATFDDITERKQAETELRQFKIIFDTANYGMAMATLDGTITHINGYFAACHGYEPGELIGSSLKTLHSEAQHEAVELLLERTRTERGFGPVEIPHCRRDGTVFPMVMTGQLLKDGNGTPMALAATAVDFSEMKALKEQLERAQRLESIGRLAGGVAHDYNNMLSVILGQTQIALENVGERSPVYTSLIDIQNAAQRSANLTRQLLAFARKQTIAPKVLDLNHTINDMITMLKHLIGEDVTLTWIPGDDLWPVKMDPSQIDQMLANLCVNARDALSEGGEITIETSNVSISEEDCRGALRGVRATEPTSGDFVLLSVTDNGCGMDAETLDQIFEPFFTTKDQSKGTGLGLSTIYGIVKQNEGMINVYSELGQGTSFKVYLPACEEPAPRQKPGAVQTSLPHGHETVLVAEDEPAILNVAQIVLERQGYTVLTAATPEKALTLAEQHGSAIDLLVTDVIMPGMNGAELANRLVSLYPKLGVLFMSGYPATFTAGNKWLEEKGYFIQKPFSMREFATKVREVLDNR